MAKDIGIFGALGLTEGPGEGLFEVAEKQAVLQAVLDARLGTGILRVTKVSPRIGLSWLKRLPLQAYMP